MPSVTTNEGMCTFVTSSPAANPRAPAATKVKIKPSAPGQPWSTFKKPASIAKHSNMPSTPRSMDPTRITNASPTATTTRKEELSSSALRLSTRMKVGATPYAMIAATTRKRNGRRTAPCGPAIAATVFCHVDSPGRSSEDASTDNELPDLRLEHQVGELADVEFGSRFYIDEAAIDEDGDAAADAEDVLKAVTDEDDGLPSAFQLLDELEGIFGFRSEE